MKEGKVNTWFAPAEREDLEKVREQHALFSKDILLIQTLEALSIAVLILNDHRQLVFANKAFLDISQSVDIDEILGLRVGEALGCIYSDRMEGGCGTSEHCRECGAVRAILSSINGDVDIQECSITRSNNNLALDLRVMASPLEHRDEDFTIFSVIDIAHEKRREVLEKIFLHDVKNTAGGIQGFSRLLTQVSDDELVTFKKMIQDLAEKLLDEINSFNQLTMAENNRLQVHPNTIGTLDLMNRIKILYGNHDVARDKGLEVDQNAEEKTIVTDETILGRVLGNMTKNALEAIGPGKTVTLSCVMEGDRVRFSVHNPGMIPKEAQLQIFRRSFSTKGTGRGIGTYSIKLLSEQYLEGQVGFSSTESEGTTFFGIYPMSLSFSSS